MREGRQPRVRQPRVRQVFLDRSGRRRRLTVLLGTGLAAALLAGLGALAVALSGSTAVDLPGFPDSDRRADAPDPGRPATTAPVERPPAGIGERTTPGPTSASTAPPTATPTTERPGNGRQPTHTPPHPKPTKNR